MNYLQNKYIFRRLLRKLG